jgi:hypothetical protein
MHILTLLGLKLPDLDLHDQKTCLEILRRFYGKHKRLLKTESMSILHKFNENLGIPNLDPENVKHVMNFYCKNKKKVHGLLSKDY